MRAETSVGPMQTDVEINVPKHAWIIWLVMGLLSAVIGTWLIFSPKAAVATLAILLSIALFLNGLFELITAWERRKSWVGYVLGGLFLVAGIVVLLRPGKSLWFLAIVVGFSIIVTGMVQLAVAFSERDTVRQWGFLAALGAVGIIVGVLAIVWPQITVWVLALLIGVRLVIFGVIQLVVAFQLKSLSAD